MAAAYNGNCDCNCNCKDGGSAVAVGDSNYGHMLKGDRKKPAGFRNILSSWKPMHPTCSIFSKLRGFETPVNSLREYLSAIPVDKKVLSVEHEKKSG